MNCLNLADPRIQNLVSKYGEVMTSLILDRFDQSKQTSVNYNLKLYNALTKIKRTKFDSNNLQGWLNDLSKQGVPKEQLELFKEIAKPGMSKEDIASSLAAAYSYTIEINTAKEAIQSANVAYDRFVLNGNNYSKIDTYRKNGEKISKEEYDLATEAYKKTENLGDRNTEYYSNLTVPGGANYAENEIATPAIAPTIKGHAAFSTNKGIGWFRSDDRQVNLGGAELSEEYAPDIEQLSNDKWSVSYLPIKGGRKLEFFKTEKEAKDFVKSITKISDEKTRRILEVQSDLFQKSRDKENLVGIQVEHVNIGNLFQNEEYSFELNNYVYDAVVEEVYYPDENQYEPTTIYYKNGMKISSKEMENAKNEYQKQFVNDSKNKFLQLLNKDNNWVTFFVKSIIQDSAKKGYMKVLFPTGNTASKVEGHTTLEQFKKQKEDRIKNLEKQNEILENVKNEEIDISILSDAAKEKYYSGELQKEKLENANSGIEKNNEEINVIKKELERIDREGFGALRPIYNFYETTVSNILKKQGYNPKQITDEYGNTWNEISINPIGVLSQDSFPTESESEELFNIVKNGFEQDSIELSINAPLEAKQDVTEIHRLLMNPSVMSANNYSSEATKHKIKTALLRHFDAKGDYYYSFGGRNWTIPKNSSDAVINEKVGEIHKAMSDWDNSIKERWINFFNTNVSPEESASFFGVNAQGDPLYEPIVIEKVKAHIDYVPEMGDKIMKLSDVATQYPDLKIDRDFIGFDPMVVVHQSTDDKIYLSLYDITPKSLAPSDRSLLFDRYLSTAKLKSLGVTTLTASDKGIRDLNLMLLAMHMRNSNDKVRFRKISNAQVTKSSLNLTTDIRMTPNEILNEMQKFLNTKEGKKFLEDIPDKFKTLLTNKKLFNIDYGQSFIDLLYNEFQREKYRDNVSTFDGRANKTVVDKLGNFLAGNGDLSEVLNLLKAKNQKLREIPKEELTDWDKKMMYFISKSIAEINTPKMTARSQVKDINKPAVRLELAHNLANDNVKYFIREFDASGRRIVEKLKGYVEAHDKLLETNINQVFYALNGGQAERFKQRLVDTSNKRFERLRKKIQVKDQNGNLLSVKSMMIHHSMSDPATKEAISRGELTEKEVEYGKFVVDSLRDNFIKGLKHEIITNRNTQFIDENTVEGQTRLQKLAEAEYKKLWTDGMIPIMNKTVSAKIFSGDFKGGFAKMLSQLQNANAMLTETHVKEEEGDIVNRFMYQMGSEIEPTKNPALNWGSLKNIERFGLRYDPVSKEITLMDAKVNEDISDDLEMISKYFVMSTERKIEYDNNVIPTLNDVRTVLNQEKLVNQKEWLEMFADRVIYHKSPRSGIEFGTIFGTTVSADAILNFGMKATALSATGINIPIGITSAAVNSFNTYATGIAQGLSGSHLYGMRELNQALVEIARNPRKVEALNQKYGVTEMNEHDLVENIKHKKAGHTYWNSKTMNWLNYATDYGARMHIMVAQMIKDGTWEAEVYDEKTGKCTYDETKDKRLYKNGVLTPEGKALKKGIMDGLIHDGVAKPGDTKLERGYDYLAAATLKDVGSQAVMGIDPIDSSNLSNTWLGKMFTQFRSYLNTKAGQIYSNPYEREVSGQRVVVKNPETGELEAQWQPEYFEGKYQTFIYALQELATLKQKPTEFWLNLKPRQKANIIKLTTDVMLFACMYALYNAMGWEDDDEYKYGGRSIPMRRFKNIWKNTNRDLINDISPAFWIETIKNPFAMVSIAEQWGSASYALMTADIKKLKKAPYPGKSTIELINETIE